MIHRALLGSIERFLGILIEHHAGEFPLWLAPVQARVLPIADRHADFARRVLDELRRAGVRAEVDDRSESVGRKIRDAELKKVPFMLVVGDEEERSAGVSVRRHGEGDLGLMPLADVADQILIASSEHRYTRAR
jgi:threonyl-tRNA synthetase